MTDLESNLLRARIADLEATLLTLAREVTAAYIEANPNADMDKVLRKSFREMRRLGIKT